MRSIVLLIASVLFLASCSTGTQKQAAELVPERPVHVDVSAQERTKYAMDHHHGHHTAREPEMTNKEIKLHHHGHHTSAVNDNQNDS